MKNNQLSPATYLSGEPMTLASLIANGIVGACPECGSKKICTHDSLSPATPAMRTDPLTPLLGLTMAEGISDVLFGSCRGSEGSREPAHESPDELPSDPDGQNDDRAEWANEAARKFQRETGTDDEDLLADLLGDLMHWADRHGRNFDADLERAQRYYSEETAA